MKYVVSYRYTHYGHDLPTLGNKSFEVNDPSLALEEFNQWFLNKVKTNNIVHNSLEIDIVEPYIDFKSMLM
jgi:hypothetical protein